MHCHAALESDTNVSALGFTSGYDMKCPDLNLNSKTVCNGRLCIPQSIGHAAAWPVTASMHFVHSMKLVHHLGCPSNMHTVSAPVAEGISACQLQPVAPEFSAVSAFTAHTVIKHMQHMATTQEQF